MRWPRITTRTRTHTPVRPVPVPVPVPTPASASDRQGDTASAPRIVALIPAHNEAERIAAALAALQRQERPPHRIVVAADNCTDDTTAIARTNGSTVLESQDNKHKKAGALNQALDSVLNDLVAADYVLVQDADTVLQPAFLSSALAAMSSTVGAVGGIFYGEQGGGLLGALQRIEFHRYAREMSRRGYPAPTCSPAPPPSSGSAPCARSSPPGWRAASAAAPRTTRWPP
ncbi:glycosyltransferase [Streptomyces roseifaciens]